VLFRSVWVSPDGSRALMLVRLRAAGPDIDGAQQALTAIRAGFNVSVTESNDQAARLVMTGAPVFAVAARDRIKSDATRLSVLASIMVATTRSWPTAPSARCSWRSCR